MLDIKRVLGLAGSACRKMRSRERCSSCGHRGWQIRLTMNGCPVRASNHLGVQSHDMNADERGKFILGE